MRFLYFSDCSPMLFTWFSYGFRMFLVWFSYAFPGVFLCGSCGFGMVFVRFSYGFHVVIIWFSDVFCMLVLGFVMVFVVHVYEYGRALIKLGCFPAGISWKQGKLYACVRTEPGFRSPRRLQKIVFNSVLVRCVAGKHPSLPGNIPVCREKE